MPVTAFRFTDLYTHPPTMAKKKKKKKKNQDAVRLGGLGGLARARNLSAAKLREQAKYAANCRWARVKGTEPPTEG